MDELDVVGRNGADGEREGFGAVQDRQTDFLVLKSGKIKEKRSGFNSTSLEHRLGINSR